MRVVLVKDHRPLLAAAETTVRQVLIDVDVLVHLCDGDFNVLLLDVAHAVRLGGEAIVTEAAREGLVLAAAVRSQVMFEGTEELEVLAAVLAHGVGRLERLHVQRGLCHVAVVTDRLLKLLLRLTVMFLPADTGIHLVDVRLH